VTLSLFRLSILLLVLSEVAGGFGIQRLVPGDDLGVFGTARPWMVLFFAVSVLSSRRRPGTWRTPVVRLGMALAALHVVLLVSSGWSPRQRPDPMEFTNVVLIVLALPLAGVLFSHEVKRRQDWMLKVLFMLGLASLPIALAGFTAVNAELSLQAVGSIRIARTAGLGAVAGLALSARHRRWIWLVPVPFWALIMLASGNRASILALVVGGFPLLLTVRKVSVVAGAALMATLVAVTVLVLPLAEEIIRFFFQRALWDEGGRIYLADRGILFSSAWILFRMSPIFGHGLGGYGELAGIYYEYPHNLTLSFASEMGLLGLLPYAVIVGLIVRAVWRNHDLHHLGTGGVFAFLFVATQFSGSYGDAFLMWVAGLAVYGSAYPARAST